MKIVWDLDGTLLQDDGNYARNYVTVTPLFTLLEYFHDNDKKVVNVCVTGRDKIPIQLKGLFDVEICRDWIPLDWNKYYSQYFQWKVDTIIAQKPDLCFEDDQQITRYLIQKGLNVVWTPMFSFMGVK